MNHRSGSNRSQCLLLVEGGDDKAVVIHLGNVIDSYPTFCADARGSVEQVLDAIALEVRTPGRRALGIVVDANESLTDRWRAIAGRLDEAGIRVPKEPSIGGTIIDETNRLPRIGIWLMPDNSASGELEDFLFAMLPGDDPVWPLSEAYIEGIPSMDRKFKEKKIRKAKLHAWLATRETPRQSGLAITAGNLEVNGALVGRFVDWLGRLFGDVE